MDKAEPIVIQSLPAIDIGVGADRVLFLERIVACADRDLQLTVERHLMALGEEEMHFLNLIQPESEGPLKSGGQLIVRPDAERVSVEMYAADWSGERPTRTAYVDFARAFFGPILRQYNKQFGTRHRLRVVKAKAYVMPPKTKLFFDKYCRLANTRSLHPLDWERFYLFVRNSRTEVPDGYLRPLLVERGFAAEKSQMLSELYHHLWRFKRLDRY